MNMIINVQTRAEGMYAPDARQAARHTKAKQADIKRNTVFAGDMNSRTESIFCGPADGPSAAGTVRDD